MLSVARRTAHPFYRDHDQKVTVATASKWRADRDDKVRKTDSRRIFSRSSASLLKSSVPRAYPKANQWWRKSNDRLFQCRRPCSATPYYRDARRHESPNGRCRADSWRRSRGRYRQRITAEPQAETMSDIPAAEAAAIMEQPLDSTNPTSTTCQF